MKLIYALFLAMGCASGAGAAVQVPAAAVSIADVMKNARAAGGALTHADMGIRLEGRANQNGLDSSYSLQFTPDGRFLERTDGPLGGSSGFDAKNCWTVDQTGLAVRLQMEDMETEEVSMWVETGRWRSPEGPFDISLSSAGTDDKQVALTLKLKKGLLESRLILDRSTWLPTSLEYKTSQGAETWSYADYRPEDGVSLAHAWRHLAGGNADSMHVDMASPLPQSESRAFLFPASSRIHDTQFDSAVAPSVPTIHTPDGHIFVHPLLNGKDVGWFFLDTGAGAMCITPEAADAAGMPALGHTSENGVGGTVQSKFRRSDRFALGPVTVSNLIFVELDLKFLAPAFSFKIGGICGYDLLSRTVLKLDVKRATVGIYPPDRFRAADVHWQQLFIEGKNAAVRCSFEGDRSAIFKLDTGAGDTVTFHAPAVQKYHMLDGRKTGTSMSGGVGGAVAAKTASIDWFELGGHRFERPSVTLSLATQGAFTDIYTAGNIGEAFLDPFTVILDYPHMRLAFVPHEE